jgi:GMP synthase (glutamine-hydrolysing)
MPIADFDLIDGVIILGGPLGMYQAKDVEWLRQERAWVEKFLNTGKPVFGICLGCQMLAEIYGGTVRKGDKGFNFGFQNVDVIEQKDPIFGAELAGKPVFQAHGDTYSLPTGATRLVAGPTYAEQGAKFGEKVYGVQFHPEIDVPTVSRWHEGTLMMDFGQHAMARLQDLAGLQEEAAELLPDLNCWLHKFLSRLFA